MLVINLQFSIPFLFVISVVLDCLRKGLSELQIFFLLTFLLFYFCRLYCENFQLKMVNYWYRKNRIIRKYPYDSHTRETEFMAAGSSSIGSSVNNLILTLLGFGKQVVHIISVSTNTLHACLLYTSPSPRDS